jgi:hypothetical protein
MDNIINLPPLDPMSLALKGERYRSANKPGSIPKGLVEWVTATELLNSQQHGFALTDIARVRAFWSYVDIGFSSAGFVIETAHGKRFYIQCAIDDDSLSDVAVMAAEELAAGEALPEFNEDIQRFCGWSAEVDAFNIDLIRMKAGNTV